MNKYLAYVVPFIVASMASVGHAEEARIVTQTSTQHTPCNITGFTHLDACVVTDITYQAPAPRNDVILTRDPDTRRLRQHNDIAVITRLRISPSYRNDDSISTVWDKRNNFLAEYRVRGNDRVVLFQTSSNGGRSWSTLRSTDPDVEFDLAF